MRAPAKLVLLSVLCLAGGLACSAQVREREPALSEGEVEKLRDTAYFPPERVLAFIAFLDQRAKELDRLNTGRRKPGREEDLHDQMEQITSIADDLDDNLADYSKRHKDIRKALPKLVAATERWATALRSAPENEAYSVSRKLALETVADLKDEAARMLEEQRAYFLAHPPPKEGQAVPRS